MRQLLALLGLCAAFALATATAATAAQPFRHVTGELWLSSPSQYITFAAFDYGPASTLDRGTVTYTNFEYPGGLSYTASVLCATVNSEAGTATFLFQIPAGFPGLSGHYVVVTVADGGSPGAGNDTYGHTAFASLATATNVCEHGTVVPNYAITAGNLVVH